MVPEGLRELGVGEWLCDGLLGISSSTGSGSLLTLTTRCDIFRITVDARWNGEAAEEGDRENADTPDSPLFLPPVPSPASAAARSSPSLGDTDEVLPAVS